MNGEILYEVASTSTSDSTTGLGILETLSRDNIGQVLLISVIAIAIVFTILGIIILICSGASKCIEISEKKTKILPKPQNALLEEDEDAVVASLIATIEFHKQTKQNARLVSIERID